VGLNRDLLNINVTVDGKSEIAIGYRDIVAVDKDGDIDSEVKFNNNDSNPIQ
jgi:hypothetical protein